MCYVMINCFVNNNNNEPERYIVKEKDSKDLTNKTEAFVLSWLWQRNLLCTNRIVGIINYIIFIKVLRKRKRIQ